MPRPRKDERLMTAMERAAQHVPRPKTDRNKTPLVGWHPPQDLQDWLAAECERRGGRGAKSAILTEALESLRAHLSDAPPCDWQPPPVGAAHPSRDGLAT